MKLLKRSFGIDVANYQPATLSSYASGGARFALVKLSEGVGYINPKAKAQLLSAKKHGLLSMGYFFATYSSNAAQAKNEARYAAAKAKEFGIPRGSFLADDWEVGDGNRVNGSVAANTDAALAAMNEIKNAGYKPLFYSGAYNLRNCLETKRLVKLFGNCLWVSAYPLPGAVFKPDFAYFPSMDGVAIWQFTDNWRGLNVDGNISLVELKDNSAAKSSAKAKRVSLHPVVKYDISGVAVVANAKGAYIYTSNKLDKRQNDKLKPQGSAWKILALENGAVKVGKGQYFDGRAVYIKLNPIAYNDKKHAVAKVILPNTHALAAPKADAKKVYGLKLNEKIEIQGRAGRFLKIKKLHKGKQVYVTDNRAYIVL